MNPPRATLDKTPSSHRDSERRSSQARVAEERESYTISVPDVAWQLLRPEIVSLTLTSCQAESDGCLVLAMSKLSGEEVSIRTQAESTVGEVASLLRDKLSLGDHANVNIVGSDGMTMDTA